MTNRVVGTPLIARLPLAGCVVAPGQLGSIQDIAKRRVVKTRKSRVLFAVWFKNQNVSRGYRVAPPDIWARRDVAGILNCTARLGCDQVQVIWKTRPSQRRKHVVSQRKCLCILPIVWNVGLVVLFQTRIRWSRCSYAASYIIPPIHFANS